MVKRRLEEAKRTSSTKYRITKILHEAMGLPPQDPTDLTEVDEDEEEKYGTWMATLCKAAKATYTEEQDLDEDEEEVN